MGYLTEAEYRELSRDPVDLQGEDLEKAIRDAERDVDALTFGRIRGAGGIERLTEYQQTIVKEAVATQVDFCAAYIDALTNPLASYGINGVSMAFDNSKVVEQSGVYTSNKVYGLLQQTGLTCRALR